MIDFLLCHYTYVGGSKVGNGVYTKTNTSVGTNAWVKTKLDTYEYLGHCKEDAYMFCDTMMVYSHEVSVIMTILLRYSTLVQ